MSLVLDSIRSCALSPYNLFVACSGGLDSSVLVHALLECGFKPNLIHINYHLRGEDSQLDQQAVESLAETHQLELFVYDCPTNQVKGKGVNLQAAAREFRRKIFHEHANQNETNRILLAHHQDDQVETFFLQLLRGAGVFGLGGMHTTNGQIIRPFLHLTKAELLLYAQEKELTWREDKSNQENNYFRNIFRNKIIPELVVQIPSLTDSIALLQEKFKSLQVELKEKMSSKLLLWEQQKEVSFSAWNECTIEEKIIACQYFHWDFWIVEHLEKLEQSAMSSCINKTSIFRTKVGFSWEPNFVNINRWEFKSEVVSVLPKTIDLWTFYLDLESVKEAWNISTTDENLTFHKKGASGKTNIHKVFKDNGIPKQWRSSYPILFCNSIPCWIPGIAVSNHFLANEHSKSILKLSIEKK